ncbi:MAG: carboxylating nicotinate-nucleotide diphosphorylase, partial [Gemmatimonadetes bacterium]|nr:carboxylating nicotinate-nucleotide diphosphorylase [Gemmatimonadota bacterium]
MALIEAALAEDVGPGDWTSLWTVPADRLVSARLVAKASGVLAGVAVAEAVFAAVDRKLVVSTRLKDSDSVSPDAEVLTVSGSARAILTAERVALNFLQRLSGAATLTRRYVDAVAGTGAVILDTRKTTPGMRALEKAAVRAGGGSNHRFGLHDMVLIKENHIAAAGGITAAVGSVRECNERGLRVEVETTTPEEIEEALAAGVDRILFDNMSVDELRAAVEGVGRNELLPRVVDAMAELEPALVESDGRRLVGEVLQRARRRSLVVLFTSLDTAPLEQGLLPLLSSLTSRHTVLLAAVADPRVEEMAGSSGSVEAVYDAAAAERARGERRRLTALLRRRGAGPTVLVSPLLALMRNQIAAAERLGIRALTVNSTNVDDWDAVAAQLAEEEDGDPIGTPLDRCEDIEVDPETGEIYAALTNNTDHGNFYGQILKVIEAENDPEAMEF